MKLHIFDVDSKSHIQQTVDAVCGIGIIIGAAVAVHLIFAYHSVIADMVISVFK